MEARERIQARIDSLKQRMMYDANDLDYETHLHLMRDLQRVLDKCQVPSVK